MKKNSLILIVSSVLAIYAIVGFVAIPKLLKPQVEKTLNEYLAEKSSIEKIEFNPFLLKLSIHKFKIFNEKETTISVDKLYIDFSVLKSIDEGHLSFKDLKLDNPYINIIENEDGTYNLEKLVKEQKEEEPEKEESESNIKFQIYKTILDNAKINFTKLIPNKKPYKLHVNKLDYTFYDMGTFRNSLASHSLRIIINKNTELVINGGLRLAPFKMYGNAELKNFRPNQFLAYKQDMLNFKLNDNTYLDLKFGYQIDTEKELQVKLNNTYLNLNNFAMKQKNNSILSLENLAIDNMNLNYPENTISINSILLNKLDSNVNIQKDGTLNFANLIKETKENTKEVNKEKSSETNSIPWKVSLRKLNIQNSDVSFKDTPNILSMDLKNININMNSFKLNGNDFKIANINLSKPTLSLKDDKNKYIVSNKEIGMQVSNLESKNGKIILNKLNLKNNGINFNDIKNSLEVETSGADISLDSFLFEEANLSLKNAILNIPTLSFKDNNNSLNIAVNSLSLDTNSLNLNGSDLKLKKAKLKTPSLEFKDIKNKLNINTKNINIIAIDTSLIKEKLKVAYLNITKPSIYLIDKTNKQTISAKDISLKINQISNYKNSFEIEKLNLYEPNVTIKNEKTKTDIVTKNIYLNVKKISHKNNKLKIVSSSITKPNISITLGKLPKETKDNKNVKKVEKKKVAKKTNSKDTFKFDIGPIKIKDMKMTFEDKNLPLPFKTDITKLNGKFSRLNSSTSKPTKLELEGKVDEYGYTKITGIVDINDIKLLTDTNLLFKNIAIKSFTPYSGKFVGREMANGKLDLDLKYNIKKSDLNASNSIVISNIKLGEKVQSPDAVNLPLELAIALLEDSNGIINIDLPVKGNVDDPEFSIAPIVWKVFTNLIIKAVTSPFALLGAILGIDGEDIKTIEFEYGKSEILASEKESLDNIAKILAKKPKLAIKIIPAYNPKKDKLALQDIKFEEFLIKEMKKIPEGDKYKEVLEDLYEDLSKEKDLDDVEKSFTKKDKEGKEIFDNQAYVEYLRKTLASKQEVSENELVKMAQERISNIKKYLLIEKKVSKDAIKIEKISKQTSSEEKWAIFKLDVTNK